MNSTTDGDRRDDNVDPVRQTDDSGLTTSVDLPVVSGSSLGLDINRVLQSEHQQKNITTAPHTFPNDPAQHIVMIGQSGSGTDENRTKTTADRNVDGLLCDQDLQAVSSFSRLVENRACPTNFNATTISATSPVSNIDVGMDLEASQTNTREAGDAKEVHGQVNYDNQHDEQASSANSCANICSTLNIAEGQRTEVFSDTTGFQLQPQNSLVPEDTMCRHQKELRTPSDKSFEVMTAPPQAVSTPQEDTMDYETQPRSFPPESLDLKFSFSPTCSLRCGNLASSVFHKQGDENFLKGCKWSPDGTQVLTNSNDNILRTFTPLNHDDNATTHEMIPNCEMRESGLVYDYCWIPGKSDSKPESCRIACSCPGSPIHLWDSNQGLIVSSYKAFDQCDEITHAYSVSFSPDGAKLFGGYKKGIRIWDTEYSHRRCTAINTFDSKSREGHKGIISCFCHGPPGSRTFVTGSYSRHVSIYCSVTNQLVCLMEGQQGGVTHIQLSPDGNRLYTGGRKDPEIVCWDMRHLGHVLCTYLRDVQTNQRIYFDLSKSGRYLTTGNHDGSVQVWDTQEPGRDLSGETIMMPCYTFQAHRDCVNGVSFNPESAKLATASGQRHFDRFDMTGSDTDSEDSGTSSDPKVKDFSLKIWSIPCVS